MKLTAYLRVSTDKQAEKGHGLPVQRKAITDWAKASGHQIASWYTDEGISGSNGLQSRAGLRYALRELRKHETDGIVFYRLDRLARDLILQETLLREIASYARKNEAPPAVYSTFAAEQENLANDPKDPTRKLIRQILGAVADYERDLIRLRLSNGRAAKHDAGGYAYGGPPYGWAAVDGALVPVAAEQDTLRAMHQMRAVGASYAAIAAKLNASSMLARRGGWHAQTVSRALARTPR